MCYIRTGITFWLGVQQKGIYTGYLIIGKETLSPKSPKFPFSLHFFPFTVLSERFHLCTHWLFSVFLYNFAREIGACPMFYCCTVIFSKGVAPGYIYCSFPLNMCSQTERRYLTDTNGSRGPRFARRHT